MTARSVSEIDIAIGAKLRAARLQAGLSQTQLGVAIGVTFQQIQKYERGNNRVAMSTALAIERALGVPATSLWPDRSAAGDAHVDAPTAQAQTPNGLELAKLFVSMPPDRQRSLMTVARVLA